MTEQAFSKSFAFQLDEPVDEPTGRPQGSLLQEDDAYPLAAMVVLDPIKAMANTLACYIGRTQFARDAGTQGKTVFKLERIYSEWPDEDTELVYPSASIIAIGDVPFQADGVMPHPMETSIEVFCPNTVLWKTAEGVADFQVDYWANDRNTRQAMAARVPALFSPGETRSGVVLAGDPQYFNLSVRATLLSAQRPDDEDNIYTHERRYRTTVRCEIDVVHLRQAVPLLPRAQLVEQSTP